MEIQKKKKPVRSKSGIVPLTVVLPPKKCNHGTCIYCPGGDFVPQSYTDKSPAIMRAMALKYDIKEQVKTRLNSLKAMGHPIEKIEVIIIGGTFLEYEKEFKYNYVKGIYDTLNEKSSKDLQQAKKINETAQHRIVALCIENRPDACSKENIKEMLSFGCTRVEIGVQMPDDELYKKTNRGHTVQEVIDATKRLKDAGFKIGYHIMPGLPYSSTKNDKEKFKLIFEDENFRPDQLKIYPCQIVKSSPLEKIYKKIGYTPHTNEEIKEFVKWMMKQIPNYCRVMRMMREIPKEKMVQSDVASTSMRGDITNELKEQKEIQEIRLREIGHQKGEIDPRTKIKTTKYTASGGKEYFIEMINKHNVLFGLARLRLTKDQFLEELEDTAIIRELHVYGQALKLKEKATNSQHKGMGKELVKEAEKIAKENKYKKIAIISGVGVREYYRKLGYELEKNYMVKKL